MTIRWAHLYLATALNRKEESRPSSERLPSRFLLLLMIRFLSSSSSVRNRWSVWNKRSIRAGSFEFFFFFFHNIVLPGACTADSLPWQCLSPHVSMAAEDLAFLKSMLFLCLYTVAKKTRVERKIRATNTVVANARSKINKGAAQQDDEISPRGWRKKRGGCATN